MFPRIQYDVRYHSPQPIRQIHLRHVRLNVTIAFMVIANFTWCGSFLVPLVFCESFGFMPAMVTLCSMFNLVLFSPVVSSASKMYRMLPVFAQCLRSDTRFHAVRTLFLGV